MTLSVQPGIYRISNLLSGKFYIGSSVDIAQRWDQHQYQAIKAIPTRRSHLYSAMRLYGLENFICEVIELCEPNRSMLFEREQHYIDTLKPEYNLQLKAGKHARPQPKPIAPPAPKWTQLTPPVRGKWRLVGDLPAIPDAPRRWSGVLPVSIDGTIW